MTPKVLGAEEVEEWLAHIGAALGDVGPLRAHIAALEADNAALVGAIRAYDAHMDLLEPWNSGDLGIEDAASLNAASMALHMAAKDPHPGAHLLAELERLREHARLSTEHAVSCATSRMDEQAEHAKALVRARNEGLEKAARQADMMALAAIHVAVGSTAAPVAANEAHVMGKAARNVAGAIRAMKETEP